MAPVAGPLASVGRALAQRITGNDYFIELGSAALNIEWAAALGAHFSPFEAEGYSEVGHCELLLALHSGAERNTAIISRPSQFIVAKDLLVVNNDVDVIDFVSALGQGDLARFRSMVRGIARPGRSREECDEIVELWNRQVRQYDRKTDRLKSMGLLGLVLGPGAKLLEMPNIISVSAAILPLLPAILTFVQEDVVGAAPDLGAAIDAINARLAGVQTNAVLLARLKKLVKGMK
ncbi:hypothetical protein [Sorangium sp. So ce1182]|uniref:hypothetical protein n=1 Tax=Sorangium sp. So ce1182 TaxID=3133334 RepID=UPI003F5ECE36